MAARGADSGIRNEFGWAVAEAANTYLADTVNTVPTAYSLNLYPAVITVVF